MLFERLFRAGQQALISDLDVENFEEWAIAKLGSSVWTWFDDVPEGYEYWLSRFDQWFMFAMKSVEYFLERQSIDYRRHTGQAKQAAHLGILKLLDALSED